VLGAVALLIFVVLAYMVEMPGRSYRGALPPLTRDEVQTRDALRHHVQTIAGKIGGRDTANIDALNAAAEYIGSELHAAGFDVSQQRYDAGGVEVGNIETERRGSAAAGEIVIVGAHYDTAGGYPGANDNGSGVAAALELARLFSRSNPARTLRFVLFASEEPPYFLGPYMGSVVYAKRCRERNENVVAMLSLETIGYYSDERGSQNYPFGHNGTYPDIGNFIGFVANLRSRALLRECMRTFRDTTRFPSEGIAAPSDIPGIGWSGHWSFWQQGYQALMVTETAPYRYPWYHTPQDTPEKLDYDRLARVVRGLERVVAHLVSPERQ
jgi:hypothetical protein